MFILPEHSVTVAPAHASKGLPRHHNNPHAHCTALLYCTLVLHPQVYSTPKFREMVKACINQDLSWAQPAKKWEAVLEEVYKGCTAAPAKKASVATPVQAKQAAMSR